MIYPICLYGDPILKQKAQEIAKDSIDNKQLSENLFETMEAANGIGLAAPQIGMSIRMFVVDGTQLEDDETLIDFKKVFINPELIEEYGEEWSFKEGCLSIPDVREFVNRPKNIRIKYFDENWNEHEEEFDGMKARIIQHEYDHLEGVLFTDYLSPLKMRLLKNRLNKIKIGKVKADYLVKVHGNTQSILNPKKNKTASKLK